MWLVQDIMCNKRRDRTTFEEGTFSLAVTRLTGQSDADNHCITHVCCFRLSQLRVLLEIRTVCLISFYIWVHHTAELHQKAKKRAKKSSSNSILSSTAKPTVQMAYDPADERDTNFATVMALMGARGWTLDKKKQSVCVLPSACPKFSIEMKDAATKHAYAALLGVNVCAGWDLSV